MSKKIDLGWVEVCLTVVMISSCSGCNSIKDIRDKYVGDDKGVIDKASIVIEKLIGDDEL